MQEVTIILPVLQRELTEAVQVSKAKTTQFSVQN